MSRPLRILVLHQHYWPEIAATAQILTDLCEDLATLGHEVTVLCGYPSYRFDATRPVPPAVQSHNGVKIRRVWSYIPRDRTIGRRVAHYATYFASSLADALHGGTPDVCLVMSTPPLLLGITGILLRLLRGVPFVYLVQDLYPDVAIRLGVLRENGVTARTIEAVSSVTYSAASAVVTLSPGMADRLVAMGVKRSTVAVVPNWADTSDIVPEGRDNDFSRAHSLHEGFVAQYSGNLGLSQGLSTVVAAADELRDMPIRFALIGDGNARASLEADVERRGLTSFVFLPPQPRNRLSEVLASCDVGLVTMKKGLANELVPSKLYGIMAAARPVLASTNQATEVARVLNEHECGWLVPPEDPRALAAALRTAFSASPESLQHMGARGREACMSRFSRRMATRRYADIIRSVCS